MEADVIPVKVKLTTLPCASPDPSPEPDPLPELEPLPPTTSDRQADYQNDGRERQPKWVFHFGRLRRIDLRIEKIAFTQ